MSSHELATQETMVFPFMNLPSELRLMIYERLPRTVKHTHVQRTKNQYLDPKAKELILITRHVPTSILATCRQVYKEANKIIQRVVKAFILDYQPGFTLPDNNVGFNLFEELQENNINFKCYHLTIAKETIQEPGEVHIMLSYWLLESSFDPAFDNIDIPLLRHAAKITNDNRELWSYTMDVLGLETNGINNKKNTRIHWTFWSSPNTWEGLTPITKDRYTVEDGCQVPAITNLVGMVIVEKYEGFFENGSSQLDYVWTSEGTLSKGSGQDHNGTS
ncbi:hypothetical protein GQ44DRAFT_732395 [Phaeosphaeriaceae sp. PMI808]|nr:hypothetical protein GQ44DRAFT_732395 [Phaeosphaeriaceae sp. PMI808]